MSVVARRFAANPVRLSSDTWKAVSSLVCQTDATAAIEFAQISGMASCLINDKTFKDAPLIVKNEGPRLKVYCLYGEDAMGGEDVNEEKLTWQPTKSTWQAFLPCHADELEAYQGELKRHSSKFFVYDAEKGLEDEAQKNEPQPTAAGVAVDWEAFKKL